MTVEGQGIHYCPVGDCDWITQRDFPLCVAHGAHVGIKRRIELALMWDRKDPAYQATLDQMVKEIELAELC